jgi:hypothetical protein
VSDNDIVFCCHQQQGHGASIGEEQGMLKKCRRNYSTLIVYLSSLLLLLLKQKVILGGEISNIEQQIIGHSTLKRWPI